jgi:hypothetical protein
VVGVSGAINPIVLSDSLLERLEGASDPRATTEGVAGDRAQLVSGIFSEAEVEEILAELDEQAWQPVGLDGIAAHYREGVDSVGSWRATIESERLAVLAYLRLPEQFLEEQSFASSNRVDHDGHDRWRPLGLNPRLRCIRYESGGLLVPHYDAPFDYGDGRRRTLQTMVLYLGCRGEVSGGATRFLHDASEFLSYDARDFSDWTRLAEEDDVLSGVNGVAGQALIFDHRILHDSEPLAGEGTKTIIRTDIVFERIGGDDD